MKVNGFQILYKEMVIALNNEKTKIEYTCRRLTENDINMVMDINKNFREGFICYDNAFIFLRNPSNWIYAAVANNVILGFAYGYELNRLNDIGNMLILFIYFLRNNSLLNCI